MGLSCRGVDIDNDKEGSNGVVGLIDKRRECSEKSSTYMDVHYNHHQVVEFDFPFWPIEHPVEPQDEDKPIKCPIPNSAALKDGGKQDQKYVESLRKRSEVPEELPNEDIIDADGETPDRAVRKRHHALTHGDGMTIPSTRTSPRPSISSQNNTNIFQMLQDLDKFEY